MSARAKLRCRRRLGSFLSKPLICFATLSDIVRKKTDTIYNRPIQRCRISGKPFSSLALVANERIRHNDGHAQRKSQALVGLGVGPVCPDEFYGVFLGRKTAHAVFLVNHNAIGESF